MSQDVKKIVSEKLTVGDKEYTFTPVNQVEGFDKLPFAHVVLLENALRHGRFEDAKKILNVGLNHEAGEEIEFRPARVLLTDFTGVPCMVDFAAMRDAMADLNLDPALVNPLIPANLIIDHSVIGDVAGCSGAVEKNMQLDYKRNMERYEFLKWSQTAFDNLTIVPPGSGICHQLNIEKLAQGVFENNDNGASNVYFDTLIGADSHTTTVNGIGVLGWGVGGIEAEAAMLGQPVTILVPDVIGFKLTGKLSDGVGAMDLALTIAEILRKKGVVGKIIEFFGDGVKTLSATDRSTVANMSPEYGSTSALFGFDTTVLDFYKTTGRDPEKIALIEAYAKAQGVWMDDNSQDRTYAEVIELDLSSVKASLAGPSRPHDRFDFADAKRSFREICNFKNIEVGNRTASINIDGTTYDLEDGAIAIAAITSCTTTANPDLMLRAGLLAKNAAEAGLTAKPWIKTMLSPGSAAGEYLLANAGLLEPLAQLGFYLSGFGCMSCIGNSGPIAQNMQDISDDIELTAVLSGNRNFEGRISPHVKQNFLASPEHVVAYALAGTMDFDFTQDSLGQNSDGSPIMLSDLLPSDQQVQDLVEKFATDEIYKKAQKNLFEGDAVWRNIEVNESLTYNWDENSTYVRKPPYFNNFEVGQTPDLTIDNARLLMLLGDFITTDHISPAGSIASDAPAADYLREHGVKEEDFNTYGSRRGNHEVMMRGTFANIRIQNKLAEGKEGGYTKNLLTGDVETVWDAASDYADHDIPLMVVAGKMYGSGSSRDWAGKGPALIGVRAALAESFERIHRSNLVGMGVLPLEFQNGENAETYSIDGSEKFSIDPGNLAIGDFPRSVDLNVERTTGEQFVIPVTLRVDTPTEGEYIRAGGILQFVLNKIAQRLI